MLQAVEELSTARRQNTEAYRKAYRTIAAQIYKIHGLKKYANGQGAVEWRNRVDLIPVEKNTPPLVLAWKNKSLREIEADPAERRARIVL